MSADDKMYFTMKKIRDSGGKIADAMDGISGSAYYWTETSTDADATPPEGLEVIGSNHANGTPICYLDVTAGKLFACTHLLFSTNIGAMARIGYGTWAASASLVITGDIYVIDGQNVGSVCLITENMPIFMYDNREGEDAVTLIMYAPHTAKGVDTNDAATKYFDGFFGGLEF